MNQGRNRRRTARHLAQARARSELFENYCALPPAQRQLVLGVIDAFSKIPTK